MEALCGANCSECGFGKQSGCKGCAESKGCPFGKSCFIASYIKAGGNKNYEAFVKQLTDECNALRIPGMPQIKELFPINGVFVNLEYRLPNGKSAKILDDREIYLGNQVECEYNDGAVNRFFGIAAHTDFLLVGEYGPNGSDPEILIYKKR